MSDALDQVSRLDEALREVPDGETLTCRVSRFVPDATKAKGRRSELVGRAFELDLQQPVYDQVYDHLERNGFEGGAVAVQLLCRRDKLNNGYAEFDVRLPAREPAPAPRIENPAPVPTQSGKEALRELVETVGVVKDLRGALDGLTPPPPAYVPPPVLDDDEEVDEDLDEEPEDDDQDDYDDDDDDEESAGNGGFWAELMKKEGAELLVGRAFEAGSGVLDGLTELLKAKAQATLQAAKNQPSGLGAVPRVRALKVVGGGDGGGE